MACEAGHDSIEIDHADGLAGIGVEEDVVDLGVVVGDAQGDAACGVEVVKYQGLFAHGEHVGHLGTA